MSAQTTSPVENVGRGSLVALLGIPAAVIIFAVIGGLLGGIGGVVAVIVPSLVAWLYTKGAGAPLTKSGLVPVIGISVVAILLGIVAGVVASAYKAFTAVGGDGGLSNPAFWTTLRNQMRPEADSFFPILIGLGLGAVGIATIVRSARAAGVAPEAAAVASADPTITVPAPPAATTPQAPIAPNQPSPGIILNGKPLDPEKK